MAARADIRAGRAYVSLYVKKDQFEKGLMAAKQNLQSMGAAMMGIGARAASMGAAIVAPMGLATKTFADFDDAMRAVGGVTRASAAQLQSMTEVAMELGRTTSYTASQVGNLMAELGRAGFNPDQVNAMTGAVLNLARATGTDATISSGIMASTMRQFNLEASEAGRVADALAMTANASFTSVEGLGESLSYAGAISEDFNVSLEDTLALLGGLGNAGVQGSMAGTALRRLLLITGAEAEKLKGIFGVTFVDAAGNARPLVDTLTEVQAATANLGTAARAAKFEEAFGDLGITAASIIGKGGQSIRDLADEIKNAGGVASKTAADMDAGLGGAFRIIMSAAEGLQLAIGEALQSSITSLAKTATDFLGVATKWVGQNKGLITSIAATGVALIATGGALIAAGLSFKAAAVGVGLLTMGYQVARSAMFSFATVAGLVRAITLSLAAAMAAATGTTSGLMIGFALLSSVQATYPVVAGAVVSALGMVGAAISALSGASSIGSLAAGILSASWTAAAGVVASAMAIIASPVTAFAVAAGAVVAAVAAIGTAAAVTAVRGANLSGVWDDLRQTLNGVMGAAQKAGAVLMTALSGGDYGTAMRAAMAGAKLAIAEGVLGMQKSFSAFFSQVWTMAKAFMLEFVKLTFRTVAVIAKALSNPVSGAFALKGLFSDISNMDLDLGISLDAEGMRDSALEELDRLEKELADRELARQAEAVKNEDPAKQAADKKAQIKTLEESGALTADEAAAALARVEAAQVAVVASSDDAMNAYDQATESIREQIIALREGEDALERYRLKQQGLTDSEIENAMKLRAEQKELEAKRKESETRVAAIVQTGDEALDRGADPREIMKRELAAIAKERAAGRIDEVTAQKASDEAQERLAARQRKLQEEGKAVSQETMTPKEQDDQRLRQMEIDLQTRMRKISQLQDSGAIDGTTATRAEDDVRRKMAELAAMKRNQQSRLAEMEKEGSAFGDVAGAGDVASTGSRPSVSVATSNVAGLIASTQGGSEVAKGIELLRRDAAKRESKEQTRHEELVQAVVSAPGVIVS